MANFEIEKNLIKKTIGEDVYDIPEGDYASA